MNNVVNLADVELAFEEKGDRFASRDARLASSTRFGPEVCEYADSDNVLAYAGHGESPSHATKVGIVHRSADVDYRDGEA
ncbi:MAG TPA: hypothetical protein VNE58_04315 [Casimicrobiaceae bacterium]|nr:hypothetical protein [Casimicrobiaceae bacterium]